MTLRRWTEENVYFIESDDSLDIDTTSEPRTNWQSRDIMRTRNRDNRDKWYGASLDETRTMLQSGWPEGLEIVHNLAEQFVTTLAAPKSFRRRGVWSEDGDEASWERVQSGFYDVWRTSKRQTMNGPAIVKLLCPWSHSSSRSTSEIQWNGVVLAVLCKLLEKSGYRVGATMTNALKLHGGDKQYMLGLFHVKHPSQPLDLASLVPLVAHSAPYRHFGIEWATLPDVYCGSGFGLPQTLAEIPNVPSKPTNGIVLNRVYNEYEAKREIERVLSLFSEGNPANATHETHHI